MKKFFAIFAVALLALVGCTEGGVDDTNNNGGNNTEQPDNGDGGISSDIAGQWHIVDWNGEAPVFDVYVEFTSGNFNIYQQVYSLYYEHFEGTYSINNDVITGSYADGKPWACGYKFEVANGKLTLKSQEDTSVVSIYEKCTIPQEIKDEATTTRASEAKPIF